MSISLLISESGNSSYTDLQTQNKEKHMEGTQKLKKI